MSNNHFTIDFNQIKVICRSNFHLWTNICYISLYSTNCRRNRILSLNILQYLLLSIFRSIVCAHSHFIEMYTIRKCIAAFPHYSILFYRGIRELRKTVYINKNNMTLFIRYAQFSFIFIFVEMVIKIIL